MATTTKFFETRQGAALVKHTLLASYIRLFVNKLGSTHPVVHYLDGYAGPGVYDDGTAGSPALAVQVNDLVASIRDLRVTFVEKESKSADALKRFISTTSLDAKVYRADLADVFDQVLERCSKQPLLAFLDPFGLTISFEHILALLNRGAPTDVLMNVSLSALRRNAGHLTTTSTNSKYLESAATIVERMDRSLGGNWWQAVWRETSEDKRGEALAHGYAAKLRAAQPGYGYFILPVSDRWDGPPAFYLMLLTRHRDGLWNFNEFMSSANEKLREHALARGALVPELFEPAARYDEILQRNILVLLNVHTAFKVSNCLSEVYGEVVGFARATHVRAAVKALVASEMVTAKDEKGREGGKGDVDRMTIRRGAAWIPLGSKSLDWILAPNAAV